MAIRSKDEVVRSKCGIVAFCCNCGLLSWMKTHEHNKPLPTILTPYSLLLTPPLPTPSLPNSNPKKLNDFDVYFVRFWLGSDTEICYYARR